MRRYPPSTDPLPALFYRFQDLLLHAAQARRDRLMRCAGTRGPLAVAGRVELRRDRVGMKELAHNGEPSRLQPLCELRSALYRPVPQHVFLALLSGEQYAEPPGVVSDAK